VDTAVTTVDTGSAGSALVVPPALAGESTVCWTVAPAIEGWTGLYVIGLDSGEVLEVARFDGAPYDSFGSGLVEHGGRLLIHEYPDTAWYVFDLALGTSERHETDDTPKSVTGWDDQILLVDANGNGALYEDIDAVVAGTPAVVLPPGPVGNGAYTQHGARLFALPPGAFVQELDPLTGDLLDGWELDRHTTFVKGVAVAGDQLHVLDGGSLLRFDLTGALVDERVLPDRLQFASGASGLVCVAP
ncbi:MAG: hypothetical protein ABMA64_35565, partial [Myxococcota bacterium]